MVSHPPLPARIRALRFPTASFRPLKSSGPPERPSFNLAFFFDQVVHPHRRLGPPAPQYSVFSDPRLKTFLYALPFFRKLVSQFPPRPFLPRPHRPFRSGHTLGGITPFSSMSFDACATTLSRGKARKKAHFLYHPQRHPL